MIEVWHALELVPKLKVSFYEFSPLFFLFLIYTSINKWLILYLHLKTLKHYHFSFGALRKCFNDISHILVMFSRSDRHLFFLLPFFSLINLTCLLFFFNLFFLLLVVMFGFGDTTSKHKNLEPSENQNYKLFFIFILLSASYLCSVFSLFHIFLSFLAFTFQETEVSSHETLQQVVLPGSAQNLMCTSHYYSQLYSHHLLEFQFSLGLEFVLLRLKLLIYA